MQLSDFDFDLPESLIAQHPADRREDSRMLIVDRAAGGLIDSTFSEFASQLGPKDLLVVNNTRVFPARLIGRTETGAAIEVFLISEADTNSWLALAKPGKRLRTGKRINFGEGLSGVVEEKFEDGRVRIGFESATNLNDLIDKYGRTPLPPYIRRDKAAAGTDRERYQTVYAKTRGSIAAPTAGLHFTPEILDSIRRRGTEIAEITLHVGYGTFQPVRADVLSDHRVMAERYEIDSATAERLQNAKDSGKRIVAVGTTTTRALESNFSSNGRFEAMRTDADLTITPGFEFQAVDAILTNFHLPQSSLLILTSTFGGHDLIMNAYRHAVDSEYRFYSYGDCMFIR
ncbi:MAG TPA: tRNA preQ1(34) S-adenosylmethionine ribosyltransferase-isomerase QueA [Pyrinomonadaceae bacterium]|nr:tRNA preQ1(34) S-adenosylmethionine ribosyltransferase-isomerase QueA [Chloracidobacterium sp.]MBP9934327.1 tRNA preQ1(34) S-adenosylmethionine ribosyltransferase-isomerase QueA [Pyrinomonadaceae bacterium]MBK7801478.1 tRNA preQ1(34) S-adenosylmethionine ribosyltransferase-isomerase QueA [Chloracidobacterium sp.]MBL0241787.1 tRNA preQ1(34) S-adenosylmethionine ribosyltransferase-isomerase QueA [Chloracidobacterium sp.]HQX55447.1 tRNA preQ1(34) S-adenosylmethionine ribosyltransferase-isomeras